MNIKHLCFALLILASMTSHADFKQGGIDYQNGEFESAVNNFKKAAELDDHRAMYALGSMYAGGQGVEQDYKQAYIWFRKAERHGRTDAQYKLGLMYEQGLGLKKNDRKAARWYHKAASVGYPPGQYKLGMMYANGTGLDQDPVKAYGWLTVALAYFKSADKQESNTSVAEKSASTMEQTSDPVQEMESTLSDITASLDAAQLEEGKKLATKISQIRK